MMAGERKRIALSVEYDGGEYFGWQFQRAHPSVQGELEGVLSRLFASPARIVGAGRTDRGVHATGQVAVVDAPTRWTAEELARAMNALLPPAVRIAYAAQVASDFHPRYDAVSRSYVYRIGLSQTSASPFHARWCWSLRRELAVPELNIASAAILGDHSFRAFAKAGQEQRGDRCIVTAAEWVEWGDMGLEFHITANRFLHHMVRYLVGTFVDVGLGRRPAADIDGLLLGDARMETSAPAPSRGLFLTRVTYSQGAYPLPPSGGTESLPPTIA